MTLHDRCVAIDLLVLDVDGVLTGGGILYGDNGVEFKAFHVRDGIGLKIWHRLGKRSAVLSGRSSPIVDRRAAELGIARILQGAGDKLTAYRQLLATGNLRPEQVAYLGDDLPDVPVLRHCGLAVAVADACPEARQEAHYVTAAAGGQGAVRETVELILGCQGHWQQVVAAYRAEKL